MSEDDDLQRRADTELVAMVLPDFCRSRDVRLRRTVDKSPDVRLRKARVCGAALLEALGGIGALSRADPLEIARHMSRLRASERRRAASAVAAAFELGRRAVVASERAPPRITCPADVAAWASPRLAGLRHEELWVLALDARSRLRGARCVAKGGLSGLSVRAADPVRAALRADGVAFVLVHNHPSGDPSPSSEDVAFTRAVAAVAEAVGVPLVDHVVVAAEGFSSLPADDLEGVVRGPERPPDATEVTSEAP